MNASSHERIFFKVAQLSGALGFGVLVAVIWSIPKITPGFQIHFSVGAVVAFVLGAIAGWMFWKSVWKSKTELVNQKRKFIGWVILFAVFTVAAFGYAMRNHTREMLIDVSVGTAIAVVFLTIAGSLFYQVVKRLGRDSQD